MAEAEDVVEPEPVAAEAEPVSIPIVVPALPVAEAVAPAVEPEPVAAEAARPLVPEPEPALPPARTDVIAQPVWPVPAPPAPPVPAAPPPAAPTTSPTAPANPWLTVAPDDGSAAPEPQWPISAQWGRTARTDIPTTLAGRQLIPRDDAAALWAASAAEVLSGGANAPQPLAATVPAAPQPCLNCGLSLSANARFCRRCGTRQG